MTHRGSDPTQNCDVGSYAAAKMLPLDFLTEIGVRTIQNHTYALNSGAIVRH